jgi:osmotically-inducible protein OsmY
LHLPIDTFVAESGVNDMWRDCEMKNFTGPIFMMAACAAAAVLAGCATEQKCGLGCPGDQQITSNVVQRLNQHPELGSEVNVQTLDHVVYLTGYVSAGEFRGVAEQVANTSPGVTRVVDTISVTK